MSRDPVAAAVSAAARFGVPHVHRAGPYVVLVLAGHGLRNVRADVRTWMCSSAAIARVVERTALTNLRQFPDRDALEVSALYAEAAYRHACRRAGRSVP